MIKNSLISYTHKLCALSLVSLLCFSCEKQELLSFQGYVEGEYLYLASSQAGRLDELFVHRGETVEQGSPLFELEHENETAAVRQAEDELRAAESQLKDLLTGKRPTELNVYRAQLEQAISAEKLSAIQFKRDEAQYQIGAISRSQLETSQFNHARDKAKVAEVYNQLKSGELPGREEQIRAQEAQIKALKAQLTQAQWRLSQKFIQSPKAGFVFDTLYVQGEWIASGNPVVSLLPPENIKIRFFVPEEILSELKIGQEVKIECDRCQTPLSAMITYISPQAEYTPPIIYSNETRSKLIFMVEAKPSIDNVNLLHPGQPIEVILHGR